MIFFYKYLINENIFLLYLIVLIIFNYIMEGTSKEKLIGAWAILDKIIDENKMLKEKNLKLLNKIKELKLKKSQSKSSKCQ